MTKNWAAREFEREFYQTRLKDYKIQKKKLKQNLLELEHEIKEIEFILMNRVRGGNKQMKLNSKPNSIFQLEK